MQSATEDRRGLLKHWTLAAVPAGPASEGDCSGKPPRASLSFTQLITQPLSCCNPAGEQLYPAPAARGHQEHPGHPITQERNSSSQREVSQVLRMHPHLFRRLILLGILQAPRAPQTTGQRLHPGAKPAEPDTGQSHARSGLALRRSTARVQRDLSVRADIQDAKFKFKGRRRGGETKSPWMESRQRHCTGPNTCTFFRAHIIPAGGGKGRASSSHSSLALLSPYAYVEPREILNESPQPRGGNHVTLAVGASACTSDMPIPHGPSTAPGSGC